MKLILLYAALFCQVNLFDFEEPRVDPKPKEKPAQVQPVKKSKIVEVTTMQELHDLKKGGKKLFGYIGAPWCVPCKKAEPVIEEYANDKRLSNVVFVYIDKDKAPELLKELRVESIPTFIYGNHRYVGFTTKERLKRWIEGRINAKKIVIKPQPARNTTSNVQYYLPQSPSRYYYSNGRLCIGSS